MSCPALPPILASIIARLTAAVPARARSTFLDLLLGAAVSKGGHVTDAILAGGLSRGWSTYYWFLEQGRWSWLRIWAALLEVLTMLFHPPVWYAVIDDSVVERVSTEAPGSLTHHNHNAKPNRPKFLRGQGWLCLAAVIERNAFAVGAVPLLLRLVRRGTNRGKLRSAGLLVHLLGQRLGHVRLRLDAWFMRAWLIHRALAAGHTVIGCVRRDLALFDVPKPPRKRRQGRPLKYGARLTPERVAALPEHRSAEILYGKLEVVRYRTGLVPARAGGAGEAGQGSSGEAVGITRRGGVGGTGAPRPARQTTPAAAADLHRSGAVRTGGDQRLRQEVVGGVTVQEPQARLWPEGCLAAVASGADALGHCAGGRLRDPADAGLHRPGAPGRSGPSRSLARSWHSHRRADPGGHRPDFTRGRAVGLHRGDLGKNQRHGIRHKRIVSAARRQSRVGQPSLPSSLHARGANPAPWRRNVAWKLQQQRFQRRL